MSRDKHNSTRQQPAPKAPPPAALRPVARAPAWQWLLIVISLVAAVALVYWPSVHNGFVTWDDPTYITQNPNIPDPDGLARIWNPFPDEQREKQYYPLVFTTFWLEYRIHGGFDAGGIHLTNLGLHAANTLLVVLVLRQLGLPVWAVWLAAGLWALHPLNAASVAWATQRKNVLSGLFYLLALLSYLHMTRARTPAPASRWLLYAATVFCFVLALLCKTAVVTLPATMLITDRLIHRRWTGRSLLRVLPLFVLGLVAAYITKATESGTARASFVPLESHWRPLAAAGAVWFYIGKALIPIRFPGIYPRWNLPDWWPLFTAALAALPIATVLLWRYRRRVPDATLWGLAHYVLALGPMLGLIPFNYTQHSFVADHFVYVPALGLFVALAAVLNAGRERLSPPVWRRTGAAVAAVALLIALGAKTQHQVRTAWKDPRSFWENTVRLNPGGWTGHYNLASLHWRAGALEQAAEHFTACAAARPDLHQPCGHAARLRLRLGDIEGALAAFQKGIARVPLRSKSWTDYRIEAAQLLQRLGRPADAERYLRQIVEQKSQLARGHLALARFCRDQRRLDEAIDAYTQSLRRDPDQPAVRAELQQVQHQRVQQAVETGG